VVGLALLAQQRPRDAVVPLEGAARARSDPVIETHLAIALRQSGRAADALTCLECAGAHRPPFWLAFHEHGLVLLSLRRPAEAEAAVRRGLELMPEVPELWVMLGTVCLDRAAWEHARKAFERALTGAPGHVAALYGLGSALMHDGDFAAAAERLKQTVAIDPSYAQAWNHYGLCLIELDRWEEGIACLRRAVQIAPQAYGDVLKTLVTTGRGRFSIKPSAAARLLRPQPRQ
jgi:tetratricopeptide (TPR) repeat protein